MGFADVVGSTKAVADGRYKAVNVGRRGRDRGRRQRAGPAAVSFVFGGDGGQLRHVSRSIQPPRARRFRLWPLSRVRSFISICASRWRRSVRSGRRSTSGSRASPRRRLRLRDVRRRRPDLVRRRGQARRLRPAAGGAGRASRSGLSCRWDVAPAKHGLVLSLIVAPRENDARFAPLVNEIVKSTLAAASSERPVTLMSLPAGESRQGDRA